MLPIEFENLLTEEEIREIIEFTEKNSKHFVNKGKLPGSLESEETAGLDYYVVAGDAIKSDLPWLWHKYADEWMQMVSQSLGINCVPCDVDTISININALYSSGSRYEWHVDSDPYSGVLFLTDNSKADGGEFVIEVDGIRKKIYPQKNKMILFDGVSCPHGVGVLKTNKPRITVVMVFLDPNNTSLKGAEEQNYSKALYGY